MAQNYISPIRSLSVQGLQSPQGYTQGNAQPFFQNRQQPNPIPISQNQQNNQIRRVNTSQNPTNMRIQNINQQQQMSTKGSQQPQIRNQLLRENNQIQPQYKGAQQKQVQKQRSPNQFHIVDPSQITKYTPPNEEQKTVKGQFQIVEKQNKQSPLSEQQQFIDHLQNTKFELDPPALVQLQTNLRQENSQLKNKLKYLNIELETAQKKLKILLQQYKI